MKNIKILRQNSKSLERGLRGRGGFLPCLGDYSTSTKKHVTDNLVIELLKLLYNNLFPHHNKIIFGYFNDPTEFHIVLHSATIKTLALLYRHRQNEPKMRIGFFFFLALIIFYSFRSTKYVQRRTHSFIKRA